MPACGLECTPESVEWALDAYYPNPCFRDYQTKRFNRACCFAGYELGDCSRYQRLVDHLFSLIQDSIVNGESHIKISPPWEVNCIGSLRKAAPRKVEYGPGHSFSFDDLEKLCSQLCHYYVRPLGELELSLVYWGDVSFAVKVKWAEEFQFSWIRI